MALVGAGIESGAAILLRHVLEEEDDVHAEGDVADGRLDADLVGVQLHGNVARTGDVGREGVDDGLFAQDVRHEFVDYRVFEEVGEFGSFVDEGPDALVGAFGAAVADGYAFGVLAGCLLLHGFFEDGDFFWGESVLD